MVVYLVRQSGSGNDPVRIEIPLQPDCAGTTAKDSLPDWTRLEVEQCSCCPISGEQTHCPAATALAGLMNHFGSLLSFDIVDATVESGGHEIHATVPAQKVLSSLLGLVLGRSGCPILARFMPMARFHLPFATAEETTFRSVGAYLMAQYFAHRTGGQADWDLVGLKTIYDDIHTINRAMVARLRAHYDGDAGVNAVAILDLYAHHLPMAVDEQLAELRALFSAFEGSDRVIRKEVNP